MKRATLKTASYAIMHLSVAIAVAYILTGDIAIALSVGIIEPMVQTVAYSAHESIWERWDGYSRALAALFGFRTPGRSM